MVFVWYDYCFASKDLTGMEVASRCYTKDRKETRVQNIRLIHEFSITGSIVRQPLLMADQACNCWFFFITNKFNGIIQYGICYKT